MDLMFETVNSAATSDIQFRSGELREFDQLARKGQTVVERSRAIRQSSSVDTRLLFGWDLSQRHTTAVSARKNLVAAHASGTGGTHGSGYSIAAYPMLASSSLYTGSNGLVDTSGMAWTLWTPDICRFAAIDVQPARVIGSPFIDVRWHRISASIDRWSAYGENWDGDGATQPPKFSIDAARKLLFLFAYYEIALPTEYISSDGEIGFTWEMEGGFASISLLADGHIVVYCRAPGDSETMTVDTPFSSWSDISELICGLKKFG